MNAPFPQTDSPLHLPHLGKFHSHFLTCHLRSIFKTQSHPKAHTTVGNFIRINFQIFNSHISSFLKSSSWKHSGSSFPTAPHLPPLSFTIILLHFTNLTRIHCSGLKTSKPPSNWKQLKSSSLEKESWKNRVRNEKDRLLVHWPLTPCLYLLQGRTVCLSIHLT